MQNPTLDFSTIKQKLKYVLQFCRQEHNHKFRYYINWSPTVSICIFIRFILRFVTSVTHRWLWFTELDETRPSPRNTVLNTRSNCQLPASANTQVSRPRSRETIFWIWTTSIQSLKRHILHAMYKLILNEVLRLLKYVTCKKSFCSVFCRRQLFLWYGEKVLSVLFYYFLMQMKLSEDLGKKCHVQTRSNKNHAHLHFCPWNSKAKL